LCRSNIEKLDAVISAVQSAITKREEASKAALQDNKDVGLHLLPSGTQATVQQSLAPTDSPGLSRHLDV
jgi:hypothetical protein